LERQKAYHVYFCYQLKLRFFKVFGKQEVIPGSSLGKNYVDIRVNGCICVTSYQTC